MLYGHRPYLYSGDGFCRLPVLEVESSRAVTPGVYGHTAKTLHNGDNGVPDFLCPAPIDSAIELPQVEGIAFHSRGQSSRVNIVNGSMSSSLVQTYVVQAERPGTYTIPPIKVTAGRESGVTKPLSFEVTAGGANTTTGSTSELVANLTASSASLLVGSTVDIVGTIDMETGVVTATSIQVTL